ncbi:hypothetical protein HMPREF9477_01596 [Lachnospiraceae bacterium 2_1_46FAA]|nr:hypothetical protein HMPREF9477_01596 [Lachnospiraceae bacterium 2_1_46FAA]
MEKNKKKVIAFFCICMLFISGCGMENSENIQKRKVAVIMKSTDSAFFKAVSLGANAAGTAYNMEILFEGPKNEEDYKTQNKMIEQAIQEEYDAIVFSAVDYNANAEAIDKAAHAGIKTIVIDSDVNSKKVNCRISTNNYKAGKMAGQAVLENKSEELNIGIVNFDKNSRNGQERERGFKDFVKKDNRVKNVETINVISTVEQAKNQTKEFLEEHQEMNVLVTFNEWTSLGVGYAVRELGLQDKIQVVAFDNNVISVGMLETGEVDALIVQNPYAMGYLGVESAYNLLNEIPIKGKQVDTETICATRENMYDDEYQKTLFAFE